MLKKILIGILFFFILFIAIWRIDGAFFHPYLPDFNNQIRDDVTSLKFSLPKDQENCGKIGGIWKKMGPRPIEECNLPTKDNGKICSGSNQCEGVCLADLTREQIQQGMRGKLFRTQGKCSEFIKVMGCRAYVFLGWAQVVCAD